MKKYTTVLLDVDDTLLDFKRDEKDAVTALLGSLGAPCDEKTALRYSQINDGLWKEFERGGVTKEQLKRRRFEMLFDELGFDCPLPPEQVSEGYIASLAKTNNVLDGAGETLEYLSSKGYELYVITNGVEKAQRARLKSAGFDKFFKGFFISETIGIQKPFLGFFRAVMQGIGEKDKSRVIVVGDSLTSDIAGALGFGLDCVWLNRDQKPRVGGEPTYEIQSLSQLRLIL